MSGGSLRILHVVNSLDPGGMENGVVNMAQVLESRDLEMHLACLERRGAFTDRLPHPERVVRSIQLSWAPREWGEDSPWMRMFRNARVWVG